MATDPRAGDSRPFRAPPPTPIATAKGSRSAAVDDRVLTEYLERYLKVPELTLPEPSPHASGLRRRRVPGAVDLPSLTAGDEASRGRLLACAAVVGAFRVDGHGVSSEDVRAVMGLAAGVFLVAAEGSGELRRYLRRRGGAREEFRWFRPPSPVEEAALLDVWPDSYATFRRTRVANLMETASPVDEARSGHGGSGVPVQASPAKQRWS